MALPLLATVSSLVRFAFPFIRQGIARGLSGRTIIAALRATGKAGRRTDLYKVIRYARQLFEYGKQVRTFPRNRLPDPGNIPLAPHKIRRLYSYLIEVSGVDVATGKSITRHMTVSSDTLLKPAAAAQEALDTLDSEQDRYGLEDFGATTVNIMQAGPSGVF